MAAGSQRNQVLKLARRKQGVASQELAGHGIHRQTLTRLFVEGRIERVAPGLYRLPGQTVSENHGLVLAAAAIPRGVICLLSALRYHGIGTQTPADIWMALDRRAWRPTLAYPPLRFVRFSGQSLIAGVQKRMIEGRMVSIYGPAKTVADCFKYRNKIGLDVAIEALREGWRERRFTMDELDRYAVICRVQRVMRPYIEALVA